MCIRDRFKREITYSTDKSVPANLVTIDAERAFEVMNMNKNGEKPLSLLREGDEAAEPKKKFNDILGQDAINRFDKDKKKKKRKPKGPRTAQDGNVPQGGAPKGERPPRPKGDKPQKPKGDRPQKQRPRNNGGNNDKPQNNE